MNVDVVVPVARRRTVDRLLYSLSRNTVRPQLITLVTNEMSTTEIRTYGMPVRVLRFCSTTYAIGIMDVALRRNVGIWASPASHVIMFDDDQIAPVNLIESSCSLLAKEPFFWGHYRYIDFSLWPVEQLLYLPPQAGKARERAPNTWHSFKSAYGGLFGADRRVLIDIGGFDMVFSGRHGGEDQNLGRRLARLVHGTDSVFVYEPPYAWHPIDRTPWDNDRHSNLCRSRHEVFVERLSGLHRCRMCPFAWAPERLLFQHRLIVAFDPKMLEISVEPC
jgi:hypothetical protein